MRDVLLAILVLGAILSGAVVAQQLGTFDSSGNVTVETNSGLAVTQTNTNGIDATPFPDSQTVALGSGNISSASSGAVTVQGSQGDALNGTTTLTDISASGDIIVNPDDDSQFGVAGGIDNISIDSYAVDDGTDDITYGGSGGTSTIILFDLPADTTVGVFEPATDTLLDTAQTDGSGKARFEVPNSQRTVRLVTGARGPQINNVRPTGTVTDSPVTLKADIQDDDFPADNVTVDVDLNGNDVGTQTVQSDSSVSFSLSGLIAGDNTVTINATDSFGNSNERQETLSFPENMTFFEIADPPQNTTNKSLNVSLFTRPDERLVFERDIVNGSLSMAGLPVDEPYIVDVIANDNLIDRRTIVFSLVEQQEVFLLNKSADTADVELTVEDSTGDFGTSSIIQIERIINTTDTNATEREFVAVAGGELGARAAFTTTVETDVRYRARIVSGDGQERQLGAFRVNQDRTVTFEITRLEQGVENPDATGPIINASQTISGSGGSKTKTVTVLFRDGTNTTDDLSLVVHEQGDPSNVFARTDASVNNLPLGTFQYVRTFTGQAANISLVANITYERGGETIDRTIPIGVGDFPLGIPLGPGWSQIFGVGFLLILGGVFSTANARIGALVIPGVALVLFQTGVLSGVVTVFSVTLAFAVAVAWNLVVVSGPGGIVTS
jgi:hypothetical protein